MNEVVTDWSYALAEFLVSSLFRAFLFLAILATFTLQMFFSFDNYYYLQTISDKLLAECRSETADIEVVRGYLEQEDCDVNIRDVDVCNMVCVILICNGS